jgi:hypothetical protein
VDIEASWNWGLEVEFVVTTRCKPTLEKGSNTSTKPLEKKWCTLKFGDGFNEASSLQIETQI